MRRRRIILKHVSVGLCNDSPNFVEPLLDLLGSCDGWTGEDLLGKILDEMEDGVSSCQVDNNSRHILKWSQLELALFRNCRRRCQHVMIPATNLAERVR